MSDSFPAERARLVAADPLSASGDAEIIAVTQVAPLSVSGPRASELGSVQKARRPNDKRWTFFVGSKRIKRAPSSIREVAPAVVLRE